MVRRSMRWTGAVFLTCAALPMLAVAGEADLFCELSGVQADAESKVLDAPYAFVNVGNPSISNKVVSAGVSKSLSQARRAGLVQERAAAECEAYRSGLALKESVEGVPAKIELHSLAERKLGLEDALQAAERNLATEQALLASNDATLADLTAALRLRDGIAMDLAALRQRQAELSTAADPAQRPLSELVSQNATAQARAAQLASRASATLGWDVTILAGMRHDFTSGSQSPFIGLTASRSFGYDASVRASDRVGELTAKLVGEQRDGAYQQVLRMRQSLEGALSAETLRQRSLEQRNAAIHTMIERAQGVDTNAARRLLRNMSVESLTTSAELAASNARIQDIGTWLKANPTN
ncbi:hypothetical protein [Ralstonia mojiangensis]|uniref:hypothetical protein n=1 Tax=Ralstonia mojiangensis TaxID=2953895 RepID=UPI002090822D|nr:hypothetical protein [Ralstonia mojiangensis]MCO5414071.1 hypothetical protein [Ralstonia mojiangensis]